MSKKKMSSSKNKAPYNGKPPFQKHSRTSREAATSMLLSSNTMRARVWKYLVNKDLDGATDEQIQKALELDPSTERPRRRELVLQGFVKDSGTVKKTTSGRDATVWVAIVPQYTPREEGT